MTTTQPSTVLADVAILWDYHDMHHALRPTDVGIGLGSHDLGVATHTADLYHRGMFPRIVFTGANAPTTIERFPRGEAVHYREHALTLGVPDTAILIEPTATNTSENITATRDLLHTHAIPVASITLISRPYQQRRAYATSRKLWPDIDVLCSSQTLSINDYIANIGDPERVINMLVGDTHRITVYADAGYAIPQHIPDQVQAAYERLIDAGYTQRLVEPFPASRRR